MPAAVDMSTGGPAWPASTPVSERLRLFAVCGSACSAPARPSTTNAVLPPSGTYVTDTTADAPVTSAPSAHCSPSVAEHEPADGCDDATRAPIGVTSRKTPVAVSGPAFVTTVLYVTDVSA